MTETEQEIMAILVRKAVEERMGEQRPVRVHEDDKDEAFDLVVNDLYQLI